MNRKTKLLMAVGIGLGMLGKGSWVWANPSADATITITPVATVSLSISPTTYAFGVLDVNTSSVTASALTLTNNGEVNVTVSKQVTNQSNPAGWTSGTAAAADTYALFASTSTFQPAVSDFTTGSHQFGAQSNVTALEGLGGATPTIAVSSTVALWFRLDVPTIVSSQVAREITVRFTGTAN
jgi:hypothetical protein